ncbi:MAG: HD domain-containing protein [Solirubrobacterales bacterium]|nr:HD domain-containing protein [Solirubrobacterales bacterium]
MTTWSTSFRTHCATALSAYDQSITGEVEVRLSEVLSGLSHALDITEGQAPGHAERSCAIGMRLAALLGLDEASRSSVFYALLLKDAGCSSNAARLSALFGADDGTIKSTRRLTDTSSLASALFHALRTVSPGAGPGAKARRVGAVARFGRAGARSLVELRCERGAQVARAIGLDEVVARAILDADEHWDGRGFPDGLAREQISLGGRLLCLAQAAEVFWRHGGPALACRLARRRRGTWFDPELVDALLALETDQWFWWSLQAPDIASLEPPDRVLIADQERLDLVAQAFAWIVDAKSPYTARHSAGVAEIAVGLADLLELELPTRATVRRAALLHDLGKLGVSNRILDKAGPLTDAETAVMQCHPRWSQEILERVPAFHDLARIAAAHHERLDGSGYFAHRTAADLDAPSRILAVADVAEALSAERPYRPALSPQEVLTLMRPDAGRKLDADAFAALEQALPALSASRASPPHDPGARVSAIRLPHVARAAASSPGARRR